MRVNLVWLIFRDLKDVENLDLLYSIIQTYNIKNTSTEFQCTKHILTVIEGLLQGIKTLVIQIQILKC